MQVMASFLKTQSRTGVLSTTLNLTGLQVHYLTKASNEWKGNLKRKDV